MLDIPKKLGQMRRQMYICNIYEDSLCLLLSMLSLCMTAFCCALYLLHGAYRLIDRKAHACIYASSRTIHIQEVKYICVKVSLYAGQYLLK